MDNFSDAAIKAISIMQEENWIVIDIDADDYDDTIRAINPERFKELRYKGLDPEERSIAKDLIDKARLNQNEKLFIRYFFAGNNPKEISTRLNISLQFVYILFRSSTKKILTKKDSERDELKNKLRGYRRKYLKIIRKIKNITPEMIRRFKV